MPDGPEFEPRRLISRDGRVFVARTAEAYDRLAAARDPRGEPLFSDSTPEAEAALVRRREYGNRPIAAGAAGAARAATLGGSDLIARAAGMEDTLAGLEEFNPGASTVGEVAGTVAPLLLFGPMGAGAEAVEGAGLLGRAGRALSAPSRALAGLSEAAGMGVGGAVRGAGTSALRRMGGTVARFATEGAIEGAGTEGARLITDAALGRDPDLTAESILARLGSGALLGAGGGALLGAGGAVIGEGARATRRMVGATADLARRAWSSSVGTELMPDVARAYASVASRAGAVDDPEFLRRALSMTEDGRRLRALGSRGDRVFDEGTRELTDALGRVEVGRRRAGALWSTGLKRNQVVARVASGRIAAQVDSVLAPMNRALALSDDILNNVGFYAGGAGAVARRLRDVLTDRASRVASVAARGADTAEEAADVFMALDTLNREVGRMRRSRAIAGTPAAEAFNTLYEESRQVLRNADLWGEAADVQGRVNDAFTRALDWANDFDRRFLNGPGARDELDAFERIRSADTRTIDNFLRQAGTVANDTAETTLREGIETNRELLRVMSEHLDIPADMAGDIRSALGASDRALEVFGRVRDDASRLNQWRRLMSSGDPVMRAAVAGTAGAVVGGPVAAALGAAVASPAIAVRALSAMERMAGTVDSQIVKSVRSFLRSTGAAAASGAETAARVATTAGRRARAASIPAAYRARVDRMAEERRNPRAAIENISARLDGMEAAPEVRNSVVATVMRGRMYLDANRPGQRSMGGQIRPNAEAMPSISEMSQFLRIARVVDNPLSILADLNRGRLTPAQVDALRTVYPRMYEEIRTKVISELASDDRSIPYARRLSLGLLFGVPTDPAMTPRHLAITQGVYAQAAEAAVNPRPGSRAPNVASSMMGSVDALASRRNA